MPVIARLVSLYRERGIEIAAGLNPSHFGGYPLAAFTWFVRDGRSLTNGLGIAMQEIYFLECLFARFRPRRLFVIGNSLGWSSLALALLNPDAKTVAIDAGLDRNSRAGIALTNRIAGEEALPLTAIIGSSPEDVPRRIAEHDLAPVDFAFIDGYHSVEQVERDFAAVRPHAAPDCVYLFHDVGNFGLVAGIERIAAASGLRWGLLLGTSSGMAIVYDPASQPVWRDDIAPFVVPPEMVTLIRAEAWNHRHRHLARWRRSLQKRLGRAMPEPALPE